MAGLILRRGSAALRQRLRASAPRGIVAYHAPLCRQFSSNVDLGDLAAVHKSPIVQHLWKERAGYARVTVENSKSQEELLTKNVNDSKVEVIYNFKDDPMLRELYANFNGKIQFSKLFEDLDALAGNVAFKHVDDGDGETRMPALVTGSVDRIRLSADVASMSLDMNYIMTGQVMWVGNASLTIHMSLALEDGRNALAANFTFVARDVITKKACKVNRLKPETEDEIRLFQDAEVKNQDAKKARAAKKSQTVSSHSAEAQGALVRELTDQGRLLHDMPGIAAGDAVLIDQTKRSSVIICQPQQRNTAGRMFGGYLMRCAYRCAFSTAYMFAGSYPHFMEIDEVSFIHPVEVGDICEFTGRVMLTYTKVRPIMHVEVIASVVNPSKKTSQVTNVFDFVFQLRPHLGEALPSVKRVFPDSEAQAAKVVKITTKHAT